MGEQANFQTDCACACGHDPKCGGCERGQCVANVPLIPRVQSSLVACRHCLTCTCGDQSCSRCTGCVCKWQPDPEQQLPTHISTRPKQDTVTDAVISTTTHEEQRTHCEHGTYLRDDVCISCPPGDDPEAQRLHAVKQEGTDSPYEQGRDDERSQIVARLRKWHEIREVAPITRRWSSIIDGIANEEHNNA